MVGDPDETLESTSKGLQSVDKNSTVRRALSIGAQSLATSVAVVLVVMTCYAFNMSSSEARQTVAGLSPDMVLVSPVPLSSTGIDYGISSNSLTLNDVETLGQPGSIPGVASMAPATVSRSTLTYDARSVSGEVVGTTQSYASTANFEVRQGRFIDTQDVANSASVVVLGSTIDRELFGTIDPIGQSITISGSRFSVVGVLRSRGFYGSDNLDDRVIIPQTTMWSKIMPGQGDVVSQILFRTRTPAMAQQVAREVDSSLLQLHQISNPFLANFSIVTQSQLVATQLELASTLKRVLLVLSVTALIFSSTYLYFMRSQEGNTSSDIGVNTLKDTMLVGLLGSVVGVIVGEVFARRLLGILAPAARAGGFISLENVVISIALGVSFAVVSLLPNVIGRRSS